MAATVQIKDEAWPKVYVIWPPETLADEEFERAVLRISGYTQKRQPYVIIHDARNGSRPSPKQRRFAAAQQRKDAAASSKWLRGTAIVLSNPLLAGVVTAINWVAPPPYPQKIFSSLPEAEAWVDARLADRAA